METMTRSDEPTLNLGSGHEFAPVIDVEDRLVGWLHTHPDARSSLGVLCQSFCAVRPIDNAPVHDIISVEPLTLSPSLRCRVCGAHGEVVKGVWISK